MTKENFLQLLEKYLNGTATEEETKVFDKFYQDFQNKPSKYLAELNLSDKENLKFEVYQSLINKIKRQKEVPSPIKPSITKRDFLTRALKVAASVVIMVGLTYLLYQFGKEKIKQQPEGFLMTKTTLPGQKSLVTLEDGSRIRLNSGSSITFPQSFNSSGVRNVELTGEAFFEVTEDPDKPFIVKTGDLHTKVIGTSFNINAYAENSHIAVTVATGIVQVAHYEDTLTSVTLSKSEQAIYNIAQEELNQQEVSLDRYLAWKENTIRFDDIPLSEAIIILERWFGVTIEFEHAQLGACFISGVYQNDKLSNILESLKFINGVEYEFKSEDKILIKGNICKNG